MISRLTAHQGYPPTVRELMAALGNASPATVHFRLQWLRRNGYVSWVERRPRTLMLTEAGKELL